MGGRCALAGMVGPGKGSGRRRGAKRSPCAWVSSQRKGEKVILIFAVTLTLAFTIPAFAGEFLSARALSWLPMASS